MQREISQSDCYRVKLYKLIPAEAIIVFPFLQSLLENLRIIIGYRDYTNVAEWFVFVIILIFIPVYLLQYQKVYKGFQLIISTLGFMFWGITLDKDVSLVGGTILIIWIFVSPLLIKTNPAK